MPNAASIRQKIEILGQAEVTDEHALASMGDVAIGIITASHYDYNHRSKLNDEFVKAYKAEFQRNPDFFSVGGYDGMHLIYLALQKSGGKTDGDSLISRRQRRIAGKARAVRSPSIRRRATSSRPSTSARSRRSAAS